MSYKVLVIGDSCIDIFQYGTVNRICPEAPCPVFVPTYKTENDGMSGNVVANLKALDSSLEIDFITNISKPYKIRYVDEKSNQMLMRQDINDNVSEWNKHWDETKKYDCAIISDYNKGFLNEAAINMIPSCVNAKITFLDTKKIIGNWAINYKFIKINEGEYNNSIKTIEYLDYFEKLLIVTKGDRGATYQGVDYPTETPERILDVSGAGDTFLAGLVYEYLKSKDIEIAIHFANRCASKVVTMRGVSTI